jgi:phage-related protein
VEGVGDHLHEVGVGVEVHERPQEAAALVVAPDGEGERVRERPPGVPGEPGHQLEVIGQAPGSGQSPIPQLSTAGYSQSPPKRQAAGPQQRVDIYVESDIMKNNEQARKPLVWLHGEVKSPPLSQTARLEAGVLLRRLQSGELLSLPQSRPMPVIGPRCHELRIRDEGSNWRIVYRLDNEAIVIGAVFNKRSRSTPMTVIEACKRRFKEYDHQVREEA